jgi:hypothetical protein
MTDCGLGAVTGTYYCRVFYKEIGASAVGVRPAWRHRAPEAPTRERRPLDLTLLGNSALCALGACLCWLYAIQAVSHAKRSAPSAHVSCLSLRGRWGWYLLAGLAVLGSVPLALLSLICLIISGKN